MSRSQLKLAAHLEEERKASSVSMKRVQMHVLSCVMKLPGPSGEGHEVAEVINQ